MSLFQPARLDGPAAGEHRRRRRRRGGRWRRGEVALAKGKQFIFVHRARRAHHQTVGRIESPSPGFEVVGSGRLDGGSRSQDGAAEGLVGEGGGLGEFEHLIVRGVGGLGDLLADDAFLLGEVAGVQRRPLQEIGERRQGQRQSAGQSPDLETGPFMAGGGVDMTAGRFDRLDDVAGGPVARALEDHVFEQM